MPVFVCDRCGCVENTATSRYWLTMTKRIALCSQCDPELSEWHGKFPRKPWDGERELWNRTKCELDAKTYWVDRTTVREVEPGRWICDAWRVVRPGTLLQVENASRLDQLARLVEGGEE